MPRALTARALMERALAMPREQIPRALTRLTVKELTKLTARELTNNLPAPRKPCPLTTPRPHPRRKPCLLIRLIPKELTPLHHHHRTTRKPTARAREVDADLWRREQRMPHRRPAVEIWQTRKRHHQQLLVLCPHHQTPRLVPRVATKEQTPRCLLLRTPLHQLLRVVTREAILQCLHHQTQLPQNPRAETKEATPQPNLPRRKEREATRLSHQPRKKTKDLRPRHNRLRKKARVRRPRRLLPKAALTAKELTTNLPVPRMAPMERAPTRRALTERALAMPREPTANLLMERALTAREPMENRAARTPRDLKMAREWRTKNRDGALLMVLALSD